jgi:cyclic pyranopterin phosphate synthase
MKQLTHLDSSGRAAMVDVSAKPVVARLAIASGKVFLAPATLKLISKNRISKGDVLNTARIAAIQAAKRCGDLIPLCHPLPLTHIEVSLELCRGAVSITAAARTAAQTGVEMEALTAVAVAALTIYDMCKAVDKRMRIGDIRLLKKTKTAIG